MATITGWYGPLIDLASASCHVDHFVQLLVFVRHSQSIYREYGPKQGAFLKTLVQVGDNSRPNFPLSVWSENIRSIIHVGDVILLQNVKITKFRETLEASTAQVSTIRVLVHSSQLISSRGNNAMAADCNLGEALRAKLKKVIEWVLSTESALDQIENIELPKEKSLEEQKPKIDLSVMDIMALSSSCSMSLRATIIDISLHFPAKSGMKENFFVSSILYRIPDKKIVQAFVSKGCCQCGVPLDLRSSSGGNIIQPYSEKCSTCLHEPSQIYRPFLLYVRDPSGHIPLLVRNKTAEILFGNIAAQNIYKCNHQGDENPSFQNFWVLLLKSLLQRDKNSPFYFEISLDAMKQPENGRFELISFKVSLHDSGTK
ncbi:hypothetical protein FCM35_KLT07496 [Carex littledalei]|uniref:Uncharacterized protein n=1 Tax=Carex littledalei TaxID=544730 RepID=A0A833QRC1_9POAL|nr:hypothetical protein FCM35_KLT07496 [Carex littledalei]